MIKANFNAYSTYVTDSLYQWDLNQVLRVTGLNLSVVPEVHFSNANMDKAIVRQASMENHVVSVGIPNSLLQDPLTINAHIGIYEGSTFKIVEKVEIPVIAKERPVDYRIEDANEEIYSFKALENAIAQKADNAVINARVDNIITHNNDTNGNTELTDLRVGVEGKVYDSAGSAVREQLKDGLLYEDKYLKDITADFNLNSAFRGKNDGVATSDTGCRETGLFRVYENEIYAISTSYCYLVCGIATYDENKNFLGSLLKTSTGVVETVTDYEYIVPNGVAYIAVSMYNYDENIFAVKKYRYDNVKRRVESLQIGNILYGKKYVACGDSFTSGDFSGFVDDNGLSGVNSPVVYDTIRKMYKTYPWWIAERNNMILVNESVGGTGFTNIDGAIDPFSVKRYLQVPTDADYITLMFGLNESGLTDEQIGNKTDISNTTLWGAYNIVFEHLLSTMPYAKIGVIISDAWLSVKYSNALKEICSYWGIPYIDLKNDVNVPMGMVDGGRSVEASPRAIELRNNAFAVSSSNNHPNVYAHEYRSTFIENFLRSL